MSNKNNNGGNQMETSCQVGAIQGDRTSVSKIPNGKHYMRKIGLQHGVFLSKGVVAKFLEKVDHETRDLRLWGILWLFKSRSIVGYSKNGVTVYGVHYLEEREGATPLAVESHDDKSHTIMLPEESKALNMNSAKCSVEQKNCDAEKTPATFLERLTKAIGCYGIPFRITIHKADGETVRKENQ